ncbi:MAG: PHP domain-containing protein, partial [Thermoleophilia bacterium]|nr:PHP domain-containing protein [Thermoleophilia bacterium]
MSGGLSVRRIPSSHDYIRSDGRGPKDGWARGPADPAPAADSAALSSTGILQSPEAAAPPFVHLHVHSNFSFLDGGSRIAELVDRAAELGQPALALTDHDGLYGAVRFAKACAKRGIQAIFGVEVCVESPAPEVAGGDGERGGDGPPPAGPAGPAGPYHLVLLAETREGYANLCRLVSAAHLAVPDRDRPPTVTAARLREHREGIICLTGCRQGQVGRLLDAGRAAEARVTLCALRDIFGPDHLYVELQHFGYEPHREAEAGQDGGAVYHKQRGDDGRLRHFRDDGHPAARGGPTHSGPAARGGLDGSASRAPRDPGGLRPVRRSPPRPTDRPDLPQGHPQRSNPADYDVGFHPDGAPWALSCLAYCDRLLHLARECGLPTVLTTDAHYARPDDRTLHLVCRAAGRDRPLSGYPTSAPGARCLRSRPELEAELESLFVLHFDRTAIHIAERGAQTEAGSPAAEGQATAGNPAVGAAAGVAATEAGGTTPLLTVSPLDTPAQIAARCRVDLELGTYHFPEVPIPAGETAYSLLAKRCFRGVERFYRPVPPRAVELLDHELAMIEQMGFAHYFLVVHDIVRWARARGIACSGRGSAGNSLVCHVLDITASEPIRHNLLFERFLNPNRREMPDIDVDFCSTRRDEVIGHIYDTFGEDNVAVVANVNTMSPRMAVRITAEAVGFAPTEINALAKNVPRHGDAGKMRDYLAGEWPELAESPLQDESRYGPLLDLV